MCSNAETRAVLEGVAFVGNTLAPFFLQDPYKGTIASAFDAIAHLDPAVSACEWPCADTQSAAQGLGLMVEGLRNGIDDSLVWEYRRLFVGPNPKPVPPWGSVYTDRECVLFGASTLALRRWMSEHGIARTNDDHMPEDHIGLMLALMAWIANKQPDLLDEYLRFHLLTWSSHMLEELADAALHPFYQGLAILTKVSLEGIGRTRNIQVTYPRFYR